MGQETKTRATKGPSAPSWPTSADAPPKTSTPCWTDEAGRCPTRPCKAILTEDAIRRRQAHLFEGEKLAAYTPAVPGGRPVRRCPQRPRIVVPIRPRLASAAIGANVGHRSAQFTARPASHRDPRPHPIPDGHMSDLYLPMFTKPLMCRYEPTPTPSKRSRRAQRSDGNSRRQPHIRGPGTQSPTHVLT